ncbi:helix-turn-helix transcriptional regulator [Alicyclobacillus sp. TC]|uniref:DNA-binding HxlR family transcriptional regulator n=2 Tax=Alicyclobacillus tolerans TaxID=90970 RepID=A0ABT9LS85_9BACL|nr:MULTISPECIES: helix-turn-helix domain-containing protein [Alicyclobacillus]MDP9727137.1 DNA-binding HxlR family transcriptional regulator [Alicyclobacillus tengchongensis]QRF22906.1 helix-turn-helix transcriptional regulator [Alicyclobacillus sp. TC]SHK47321.1 transcriptional regulator, HxlR family [Alicyclobacillus montanus]
MQEYTVCPKFEEAFSLLGKRWTGLILRSLLDGAKRFSEIEESIPGMSARMLTERFKELENAGILERIVYPQTPVRIEYKLTEKGRDLAPALESIQVWANKWCKGQQEDHTVPSNSQRA